MSARKKPTKRDAILNAMLDVVVERGFHEAPMSLIAERSGASAGVIYHHFASKDEIILALYERVHTLKVASFLDGYSPELDAREAFLRSWVSGYRFYREHQPEMRFLEQYQNAGFVCRPDQDPTDALMISFKQRFSPRSKGGVLKDWPEKVLEEMTIGLVARLASQPAELPEDLLLETGEEAWKMVRA